VQSPPCTRRPDPSRRIHPDLSQGEPEPGRREVGGQSLALRASAAGDRRAVQAMDTDGSGGLDSREFCMAMKQLVSSRTLAERGYFLYYFCLTRTWARLFSLLFFLDKQLVSSHTLAERGRFVHDFLDIIAMQKLVCLSILYGDLRGAMAIRIAWARGLPAPAAARSVAPHRTRRHPLFRLLHPGRAHPAAGGCTAWKGEPRLKTADTILSPPSPTPPPLPATYLPRPPTPPAPLSPTPPTPNPIDFHPFSSARSSTMRP
jgi:hypothetical protein